MVQTKYIYTEIDVLYLKVVIFLQLQFKSPTQSLLTILSTCPFFNMKKKKYLIFDNINLHSKQYENAI